MEVRKLSFYHKDAGREFVTLQPITDICNLPSGEVLELNSKNVDNVRSTASWKTVDRKEDL